ncbi:MAG: PAS domain S-box protein [Solirubrobacterales bacterium]|nr:PAS domain S-box protein [Solirubrobacterales bacterium]
MRGSTVRTPHRLWVGIFAVVLTLSVGGFLLAQAIVRHDQRAAALRRAADDRVRAEILLERAKNYLIGLSELLAGEPSADQQRFVFLAGTTITSFDLVDALWIESTSRGLVVRYSTAVAPGTDVSSWPVLATPITSQGTVFATTATGVGSLDGMRGFWLLQSGRFGSGTGSAGYLALFLPQGWMARSLEDDPGQVEMLLDGRPLEGRAAGSPVGQTAFQALDQTWRIRAVAPPATTLDTSLPWMALAWPWAAALVAGLIASAFARRRRAEREVDEFFDLSLDLLCIAGVDGYLKRVNPGFERTLGYDTTELLTRPFLEFVHPDDREATKQSLDRMREGHREESLANRWIRADGSPRFLEWNATAASEEKLVYAVARDVTESRQAAEEQAALRRVATLVARAAAPDLVFAAVAEEVGKLLSAYSALIGRYGSGPSVTVIVAWRRERHEDAVPLGRDVPLGGENIMSGVFAENGPVRIEAYSKASGALAELGRESGVGSAIGVPITVEGRLWGVVMITLEHERAWPPDTEDRLANFTDLAATAIANADGRAQLVAARRRVIEAADAARARLARDIHDGAQQRFLTALIDLQLAQQKRASDPVRSRELVDVALVQVESGIQTLRELAAGVHPGILSNMGLTAALQTLARRMPVPLSVEVDDLELSPALEASAYFFCLEALANVVKHAKASAAWVRVGAVDGQLWVEVGDDGVGGAVDSGGTGLVGLRDRIGALEGSVTVRSPRGVGTTLVARIPLPS